MWTAAWGGTFRETRVRSSSCSCSAARVAGPIRLSKVFMKSSETSPGTTPGPPLEPPQTIRFASGRDHVSHALLGVIVFASAGIGYLAGATGSGLPQARAAGLHAGQELVIVEASFDGELPMATVPTGVARDAAEFGRLKAEFLRLRLLFQRLAEVAELDDGEFDLELSLDDEPLSTLVDPMLEQSESLRRIFLDRRAEYDRRISGRPVLDGAISSGFGDRVDPLTGELTAHRGLDFVGQLGEPVLALADGIVTYAGKNGGYGNLVELEHVDGYRTRYAHNDTNVVELGARVSKGQQIATLGSSGRSTGPHLHLEVRRGGTATDPRFFVR